MFYENGWYESLSMTWQKKMHKNTSYTTEGSNREWRAYCKKLSDKKICFWASRNEKDQNDMC